MGWKSWDSTSKKVHIGQIISSGHISLVIALSSGHISLIIALSSGHILLILVTSSGIGRFLSK